MHAQGSEPARNGVQNTLVCRARQRGQVVRLHGWTEDVIDGLLRDLCMMTNVREDRMLGYPLGYNPSKVQGAVGT